MGVLLSMAALLAAVPAVTTVRVSDFGCDADDSTRFIQAALDAGAETVILDRKGSPWMADSLFLRSNTRLVFEPGVELCARKGALADPRATLLSFLAVTNVTVSGAGGTVRLRREDYAKPPYRASQHRHAIACRGGVNVTVEGLTVVGAGGDGVYVCGDRAGNPTRNLTVRDVTVTNSYRQGMSVISVKGLLVERVKLLGTRGTAPEAGIDFEPNFPTEFLQEIVVRDTLASGNAGNGFGFSLWRRTAEHPPITARFENCRVEGGDCSVFYQSDSPNQSFPQGGISFRNCTFANAARAAVRLSQKPKRAVSFRFENCRAENCGGKRVPEILLYPGQRDDPPADGIDFGDFEIVRGAEQSGKRFFEAPTGDWMPEGVTDLTGRITLVEPSGSRTVALDETWRKATFRPASVGATPARLEPDVANLDVRDVAPGAWRELTAIPVRFKSRWLVWAERPRRIRLRVAQAKVTVYKASQKPLRLVDPNGRKLAEFPMPVFEAPGEIAFDAPMRGLYALAADVSGNTFAITASDAPVALSVGTEPLQLMGLRGTVRFCAADAFALFTRGQGSVRLTDPKGADCVSYAGAYGWNRYLGKGAPGLFALSIDSRTLHLDLLGAQGHLFPDAGRSWTTGPKPLDPFPFPDRLSACVWRNWGLVPTERLAATLGATVGEITALAGEMGLKPDPVVLPAWRRKGYITIVRRNWHLLPEAQILQLIDMDAKEFAYRLKEDDFLWHKLGFLKPSCGPLAYTAAAADAGRAARRRIAEILKEEGVDPDAAEEPRFAFVDALKALDAVRPSRPSHAAPFTFRMISSYFADYGDPLVDDDVGSFPEGLLQKLADEGVNAVWMHVVLNTLVKDARYPEFGAGSERRLANLKRLVARAQKYGIKVYLYLNEPRCLSTAFFEKEGRAAIRGAVEAKKGVAALCTSVPEVRRWLRDSLTALFSEVKGLGGVFTITMSENLTNCASHSRRETCPRCKGRSVAEILAEVNRTIAEGVAAGDPAAETIVWNWAWPKGVEKDVLPKLPKRNCRVMHVSENGIPVTVGGVTVPEHDYSIAIVGPGENAKSFWRTARANGLPVLAKVQACNSWELSSFPFIPALDLVAEQAANLTREGVEGVMLSWSCGSAPAMNLRVYGGESLDEIAADVYGAAAAPFVRRAWTAYSEGFRRYPFDIVTVYKGPMQWGPANPLYPKPTGYQATMVGFPYDALRFGTWDNQWHGRFPVEAWIARFDEVAQGFAEGNRRFAEALAHVEPAKRAAAERDLAMFRAEEMHFRSTVDQSRFILARDAGNTSEIRRLAMKELATAKAYLPLVRADSRIGYECSNHYYYVPRDVVEKILACRLIADAAKPRTVRKPEISWSVMHPIVVEPGYMKRLVAKAAEYGGVDSFEICGECNQKHGGLNGLLAYEPYPKTAAAVDHAVVETYRRKLRETVAIAHAAGKPVYFWHREGFMPKTMHEDVPGLLDEDGEYDLLGKPYLDYVRWKVCEAFRQVPELDGVVLTLTEADFSVIHNSRPDRYPPAKVVETITRIFLEEHRRLGKRLIFRSFGSIKSDYESLIAGANACADDYDFEIETKITPYDFSPFLPANPYLKKTSRCTIGAECDGLGEYLGCGYLPCAQVEAIRRYVGYGRAADVDRYTIRIDRVGNSIFDSAQEVNLYAYHRFIQDPSATVERVLDEWAAKRWPKCAAEMKDLAAKSFRLVEATQFIDHNVCFHQNPPPPSFKYVKFSGIFGTFRDGMDLHMTEPMWGMMSDRKTPGRAAIRAEKALAERLATEGFAKLQALKGRLDPAEYARQFRAWSIAAKAVPAMRAYYDCVCAYFDDMDANDAAATRLTAAIAAAEKVILPRMKSTKVDLSEFNLNACRARGEDLDKVYFVTFLWLSRELLNEYRADFAARQKFLSRMDVLEFVIPGGIYDDVRVRRVMHASYQTIDGGVPVRFVGNAAFPNGTIAVEFRDVPGAKVEIDADPAYAKDFNVSETVANGIRTVTIAKKGAAYPGIRSIALVRPDVVVETAALRLVIGGDGCAKSLVCKATGEECLVTDERVPLFESVQVRPFNNETRLVQQAKRTAYPANRIRRDGDRLVVGFETAPYEVVVQVTETESGFVTFRAVDLVSNTTDERQYYQWHLDVPPVEAFRLLQLPVRERANFGDWLNVMWDERAFVGVMGGTPYMDVDSERRNGFRKLTVDALKPYGLTNGVAVLAIAPTKEAFLSQVDAMERDLGLPRGVRSRKDPRLNASIFWIGEDFRPENVDEIIRCMKMGGFRMLLVYFPGIVKARGFSELPDYGWNEHWNTDLLTQTLARFRREGISVGFHTLQTFVGLKSKYVTPEADHRLALLRRFTLAQALPADERPCEIYVEENPVAAPMQVNCRFLKFGTEIFHYEGYTTTRPYKFTGVTRRHLKSGKGQRLAFESRVKAHPCGEIGGVLGISECAAESAYVDQDSSLQDEIAEQIARIYTCGFDFLYFDGSENANEPCSVNISLSQYRCVEACARAAGRPPLFTEGCAKSHFGWHFQSGGNAFDMFGPEIFKEKIVEYPCAAARRLAKDFTRVDFGWWGFWPARFEGAAPKRAGLGVSGRTVGTQLDMWEYGLSKAAAFDCSATMQLPLAKLRAHRRAGDVLETVRRWEDVRARGWLSPSQKKLLRDPKREWHLYRNEKSEYELVEWRQLAVAGDLWSRVRAFVFERGGKRVVAYWDIADKSRIVLADGKGELEAENLAYWTTELSRTAVEAAFAGAAIKPMSECETRQSLRETSWLWGHETGQVDGPKNNWGLAPATNDYPMVEAAKSLGLESLNVIRWDCPDKAFRDTLRGLRRVTWPMCGIPKAGVEASFDALCDWNFRIAAEMPNVTGFDLDDFFRPDKKRREFFVETSSGWRRACPTSFPYEKLVALRKRMDAFPRPLELRTVVYDDLFHQCLSPEDLLPLLELTDVVTYWTWKGASTDRLEENFATLRRLVPTKRIQLGIYLYDFGDKKEMDVRYLERQLAVGLARWRHGEIEGFVFLCSSLCNRDTPAVRLVRDWLKRHGDETRTASVN